MDSLFIDGIEVSARIGVPYDERQKEQSLMVNIELFLDLAPAGTSDDVTKSIDYFQVTQQVQALAKKERKTIEAFAEDTAQMILHEFKPENGVKVSVWKYPKDMEVRGVCVTVVR